MWSVHTIGCGSSSSCTQCRAADRISCCIALHSEVDKRKHEKQAAHQACVQACGSHGMHNIHRGDLDASLSRPQIFKANWYGRRISLDGDLAENQSSVVTAQGFSARANKTQTSVTILWSEPCFTYPFVMLYCLPVNLKLCTLRPSCCDLSTVTFAVLDFCQVFLIKRCLGISTPNIKAGCSFCERRPKDTQYSITEFFFSRIDHKTLGPAKQGVTEEHPDKGVWNVLLERAAAKPCIHRRRWRRRWRTPSGGCRRWPVGRAGWPGRRGSGKPCDSGICGTSSCLSPSQRPAGQSSLWYLGHRQSGM